MSLDLSDDDLDQLASQLAGRLPTGRYGGQFVLSRRQLLSLAGGSAGVAALVALGVDPATAQSAAGQVGTSSSPEDVFAYDLDVQNGAEFNGSDVTGVGSLSTDDLDVSGSDFVSSGSVLPLETVSDGLNIQKTNTSYERVEQGSFSEPRVLFSEGQVALRITCRMGNSTAGETTFARLALTGDAYPATEISVTGSTETVDSGWVAVDPQFGFPNRLDLETRVSGGESSFSWQSAAIGVQF